jgi:hypothetical protein
MEPRVVVGELPVDAARRRRAPAGAEGQRAAAAAARRSGYRERAGDGSFGGAYAKDDDVMLEIWQIAVEEARTLLESGWR